MLYFINAGHELSVCHTVDMRGLSVYQTYNSSVCYTIILTRPSIYQLHDLSVCQPTCNVTRNTVCKAVCPSSVPFVLPSAKFTVKMLMSIPVQKFPLIQYSGKILSICTSMDSSVDQSDSPSITLSLSTEKPLKIPSNNGEKYVVNYLHEIPVESPSVHTSYSTFVIAPICALSIPSIHASCVISVIAHINALDGCITGFYPKSKILLVLYSCE